MLTLYRRHVIRCPHRSRRERRCKCPLHVEGTLRGEQIRKALDLTSWEAAQDCVRDMELGIVKDEPITIADAKRHFLEDAEARKLSRESVKKYRGLLTLLEEFSARRGVRYLRYLDLQMLRDFRGSWRDGPVSSKKKLERLRSFFRFAQNSSWVQQNPVLAMRPPKITQPPTLPFTKEEVEQILWACDLYPETRRYIPGTRERLKALTLLMRYSGLRIGDAVTLAIDQVVDDRLFIYTQKTNVPVLCPLPPVVLEALADVDPMSKKFYFWSGDSDKRSITGNWQRRFRTLFALSGVTGAHAHRFRDTFSVELLIAGVPIEDVSILLGHSSVRITERAYAPWVQARQLKLEAAVRKAW